jgi:hypothetical protein
MTSRSKHIGMLGEHGTLETQMSFEADIEALE